MNRYEYNGMAIQSNADPENPQVKVFVKSCFLNPLYVTTSLDLASRWIDAYRKGEQLAVDAMLPATVG